MVRAGAVLCVLYHGYCSAYDVHGKWFLAGCDTGSLAGLRANGAR